jgi:hypothetical protein
LEIAADALSAAGNVAIAAGGVGATMVLGGYGVTAAAIGAGAVVVLNNYNAVAEVATNALNVIGLAATNILPAIGYDNPTVGVDPGVVTLTGTNSVVNLPVGEQLNDDGGEVTLGAFEGSLGSGLELGYPATTGGGGNTTGESFSETGSYSESDGFSAALASQTNATLDAPATTDDSSAALLSALSSRAGTTTQMQAFEGAKWAATTVTYSLSSQITGQAEHDIERALSAVSGATGIKFEDVVHGGQITFQYGDLDTTQTGRTGTTTYQLDGTQMTGATITLDSPQELASSGSGVTLEQDALHELGHAMGLADDADPDSVMYYALGPSNQSPDTTDLANLATLYGTPSTNSYGGGWDHSGNPGPVLTDSHYQNDGHFA